MSDNHEGQMNPNNDSYWQSGSEETSNTFIGSAVAILIALMTFVSSDLKADGEYPFIDAFIKKQEKETTGYEYKEPRRIVLGDVAGDNAKDILVFYTIEGMNGGNDYSFFLAVFKNIKGNYHYRAHKLIGGKLIRFTDFKEIKEKQIYLEIKKYSVNDPSCCPSIKGVVSYSIIDSELVENK